MTPKKVATAKDPSIAWAEHLWQRLETNLLDVQNTIIAIIDAKAWEPLGYESFSKAWIDRISARVSISAELRPHVVYQMFNEGLTADQVADAVKGVTPDIASVLKRQMDHGTPPDQATTIVRRHPRRKPRKNAWLRLEVGHTTLTTWRHKAKAAGRSVDDIALEAIANAFDAL